MESELERLGMLLVRQQAAIDVLTTVMGNVLPAYRHDIPTRARLEAALESFAEAAAVEASPVYLGAARECMRLLLRSLHAGHDPADPKRFL